VVTAQVSVQSGSHWIEPVPVSAHSSAVKNHVGPQSWGTRQLSQPVNR
jgi:hypothetical protein